ncbi:hypothetical protein HDU97_005676 [Phlyctochytrium planicorne]|nr:hypothetical protein HDU97_005676 [Phlyctochytrium planicorne]
MPSIHPLPPSHSDVPPTAEPSDAAVPVLGTASNNSSSSAAEDGPPSKQHPTDPANKTRAKTTKRSCDDCRLFKRRCDGKRRKCAYHIPKAPSKTLQKKPPTHRPLLPSLLSRTAPVFHPYFLKSSLDPLINCLDDIGKCFSILFEDACFDEEGWIEEGGWFETERMVRRTYGDSFCRLPVDVLSDDCLDVERAPESLPLRFASSAYAAIFSVPKAPYLVIRSLYDKALAIILKRVDEPSLQNIQAVLIISVCAASLGNLTSQRILTGVAFRMVDHLTALKNPDKPYEHIYEDDPVKHDIWSRCLYSCIFFDNALSFVNGKQGTRFLENRQKEAEDAIQRWKNRYPKQEIPVMLILAQITTILYNIHMTAVEKPTSLESLRGLYTKLLDCKVQLDNLYQSIPQAGSFNAQGEWVARELKWTNEEVDFGAIGIFLFYQLGKCMVYRPVLTFVKSRKSDYLLRERYARTMHLAKTAAFEVVDIIHNIFRIARTRWSIAPFHAFSFYWAGLVLSDLAKITDDLEERERFLVGLECVVGMMTAVMETWPSVLAWLNELGRSIEVIGEVADPVLEWIVQEDDPSGGVGGAGEGSGAEDGEEDLEGLKALTAKTGELYSV